MSMSARSLVQRYNRAVTKWQASPAHLGYPAAYADLVSHAHPNTETLDLGTGTGAFALAYAEAHAPRKMTLLDPSNAMLDQAVARLETHATLNPIVDSIGTDHIAEHSQSTILAAHVVEHTPNPAETLRWIKLRLRPSGQLVMALSKPHWCTTLVRWRWGHYAFPPETVRALLCSAGFTQIETHPFKVGPPSHLSCGYLAISL